MKVAIVVVEKSDGTLSTAYLGHDRAEAKAKAKSIAEAKPVGTSAVSAFTSQGVVIYRRVWARGAEVPVEAPKKAK